MDRGGPPPMQRGPQPHGQPGPQQMPGYRQGPDQPMGNRPGFNSQPPMPPRRNGGRILLAFILLIAFGALAFYLYTTGQTKWAIVSGAVGVYAFICLLTSRDTPYVQNMNSAGGGIFSLLGLVDRLKSAIFRSLFTVVFVIFVIYLLWKF